MKHFQPITCTLVLMLTIFSTVQAGNIGGLRTNAAGNIGGLRTHGAGNIGGLRTNAAGNIGGVRTNTAGNIDGMRTSLTSEESSAWGMDILLYGDLGGLIRGLLATSALF
jgi:hypothetical protein